MFHAKEMFVGLAFAIFLVSASSAQDSSTLLLGPIPFEQIIQGVKITITSKTLLSLQITPESLEVTMKVEGDLSDLQSKIGSIIDTIPLPKDNCSSYKVDIPLPTIWGKELQATGNAATLRLHGYVDVWQCIQNPVPNSKVEWNMKRIGFIMTKVPKIVTWPGDPIKNKGLTQPFDVSESVELVKIDSHTVALQLGQPDIKLGGPYVFITNEILKIAGVDLNQKAEEALDKAIDPDKLRISIPDEIIQYNPLIDDAYLRSDGPILVAVLELSATIPAAKIDDFLTQLLQKMNKKT